MRKRIHIVGSPGADTQMLLSLMAAAYQYDDCLMGSESLFQYGGNERRGSLCIGANQSDVNLIEEPFLRDQRLYVIYMARDPRTSVSLVANDRYCFDGQDWLTSDRFATEHQLHPRLCIVKHEDLLRFPVMVQDQLEASFQCLKRVKGFDLTRVAWEAQAGSVDWRMHLPRVKAQLNAYPELSSKLRRYCYEKDDEWRLWFEGVEAEDEMITRKGQPITEALYHWWIKHRYYHQRHC